MLTFSNSPLTVSTASLIASCLVLIGFQAPVRAEVWDQSNKNWDLGNHYILAWTARPNSGSGWLGNSWSGDVSWWTVKYNVTTAELEMKPDCGKGTVAGSSGYPKLIDSTAASLRTRALWTRADWGHYGKWAIGCTIWTDDTNPTRWVFTNEIMIFDRHQNLNPWEYATKVGTFYHEGSNYDCYTWPNADGNRSYIMTRQNQRDGGWLDVKIILNWLRNSARGAHRLQNHYIDQIVWGPDIQSNNSGQVNFTNISVPNL
jgi:hypothetical protein